MVCEKTGTLVLQERKSKRASYVSKDKFNKWVTLVEHLTLIYAE